MYPNVAALDHLAGPTTLSGLHNPVFNIYRGKSSCANSTESKRLPIQFLVYDTLVDGISSAIKHKDFRGVMALNYQLHGEEFNIVFAMWYSKPAHLYFLTSLGQYSATLFQKDIENFRAKNRAHFQIRLNPIHPAGLENLAEKLRHSNLSRVNVCIMENTVCRV